MTYQLLCEYRWYCRKKGRLPTIWGLKAYALEKERMSLK